MQESARLGNLDDACRALNLLNPSILDYNGMLHCYFKSGRVSVGEVDEILRGMKRFGPPPNVWTFNILFNGFCSLGLLKTAFFALEDMCHYESVPSFRSLLKLMKKSLSSGIFEISVQVLELMMRCGYMPSLVTVNRLIAELCREKRVDEAYHVFSIILEMGLVPDLYTCNSLLFGVCRSGWCWQGLSLFYSFRKRGVVPNVYTYTSLVMGFSDKGLWKEAYWILEEMKMDGCLPTVVTYTVLIKSLCKHNLVDEGLRVLKIMREEGCHFDLIPYNVLLHALFLLKRVSDAKHLIRDMEIKGLFPDQYTCCAIAAGLLKNGYVTASHDLLYKAIRGNIMDIVTWNMILRSLCLDNRPREAMTMLSCMIKSGFFPNNLICNIILKGLCMECMDEALYFFNGIHWGKNGPDMISSTIILSEAYKQGNFPMIRKVLCHMDSKGLKPNIASMTCLIQFLGESGKSTECINLLIYMIHVGYSVTAITIAGNMLLNRLCKKGLLSDAKRLFNKFKDHGTFPDITSYNILIDAYIRKGNLLLAQCFLFDMYGRGLVPDATTYRSLTYAPFKETTIDVVGLKEQMAKDGVRPSVSYYNSLLGATLRNGAFWDAYLLLVKMEIQGIESDAISCEIFDHAMSPGGRKRFSKAMKVLEIIIREAYIFLGETG